MTSIALLAMWVAVFGGFQGAAGVVAAEPPVVPTESHPDDSEESGTVDLGCQPVLLLDRAAKPIRSLPSIVRLQPPIETFLPAPARTALPFAFVLSIDTQVVAHPIGIPGRLHPPHSPPIHPA